jgi:MFS family permease
MQRQVVVSACFGTFLEWYDFLTFASLATVFGQLFYPADDPVAGLLASLATFGVGMLVRPLGAAFFGSLGDRIGRRKTFLATIILMGAATVLVGLLPTYAQIGLWAPVALVLLRMAQGMAVGGEIGGAAVYLTEHAPLEQRGLYTSVLQLMGPLGIMASSIQVIGLQFWLSAEDFQAWGWRIPFLLSALLLAVSLKSRLSLHESPVFKALSDHHALIASPLRECWRDRQIRWRMLLLFSCISAGGSLIFFSSQVYAGVFLKTVVGLSPTLAGGLLTAATLCLLPLTLLAGAMSDRVGRRPILLAGLALGAVALLPVFHGLAICADQPWLIFLLLLILVVALACVTGPQTATLAELFPARVRYSAVALPHNLAAGWIGGLSPLVVAWLGLQLDNPFAGLWYLVALLSVAFLIGWRYLPETRGADLNL